MTDFLQTKDVLLLVHRERLLHVFLPNCELMWGFEFQIDSKSSIDAIWAPSLAMGIRWTGFEAQCRGFCDRDAAAGAERKERSIQECLRSRCSYCGPEPVPTIGHFSNIRASMRDNSFPSIIARNQCGLIDFITERDKQWTFRENQKHICIIV